MCRTSKSVAHLVKEATFLLYRNVASFYIMDYICKMKKIILLLFMFLFFQTAFVKAEVRVFDVYIYDTLDYRKILLGVKAIEAIEKGDYLIFKQLCGNRDTYKTQFVKASNHCSEIKEGISNYGTELVSTESTKSSIKQILVKRIYYEQFDTVINFLFAIEVKLKKDQIAISKISFTKRTNLSQKTVENLKLYNIEEYVPLEFTFIPELIEVNYKSKEVFLNYFTPYITHNMLLTDIPVKIELFCKNDSTKIKFSKKKLNVIKEFQLNYVGSKYIINKDAPYSFFNQLPKLPHLEKLKITGDRITELLPSIGKLKNLKSLEIECPYLREIPVEILHLKKLKKIRVSYNKLSENSKFIYYKLQRQINGKSPITPEISKFISNAPETEIRQEFIFKDSVLKTYEFMIVYNNTCSWYNYYAIGYKDNQWDVFVLTTSYKLNPLTNEDDLIITRKQYKANEEKIGFLLNNLNDYDFGILNKDSIRNQREDLGDGRVRYIDISDGCSDVINIYNQKQYSIYYAHMPDFMQTRIPNLDREKFIICRNKLRSFFDEVLQR